jgi:hypothetical protein
MATRPTDDQFAFVLTPSEPPPNSSSQPIPGGLSTSDRTGGVTPADGSGGCTVCHHGTTVAAPEMVSTSAVASPMGGSDGCTVCRIHATFDPTVGQISITLPRGDVPAIRSAAVITRSGTEMRHYDVDVAALRSLLLTGRVDWYVPAASSKPTSVVVTFRLEGEADDAPAHDVKAL